MLAHGAHLGSSRHESLDSSHVHLVSDIMAGVASEATPRLTPQSILQYMLLFPVVLTSMLVCLPYADPEHVQWCAPAFGLASWFLLTGASLLGIVDPNKVATYANKLIKLPGPFSIN